MNFIMTIKESGRQKLAPLVREAVAAKQVGLVCVIQILCQMNRELPALSEERHG